MPSSEMQAERGVRNGNSHLFSDGLLDGFFSRPSNDGYATIPTSSSSFLPSSSSSSSPSPSSSGLNYIEHRVTKMDTLAGVAIKYGVEVADIRRMNGLVTDLQMFAHKSLQIPLPGRHPRSPIMSNGSAINGEETPPRRTHNDVLDSLQSLKLTPSPHTVSPAMSSLQGYYGLKPPRRGRLVEGTEMAVYKAGRALYLEDEPVPRQSPMSEPLSSRHRKSRSLVNGFAQENGYETANQDKNGVAEAGDSSEAERSIRRRQKADTPEILMKEDNCGGGFSGRTGKGLALRPKLGSRTDMDTGRAINYSIPSGDSFMADVLLSVRKSSSTSNLQDSENGTSSSSSSSIWPTSKWTLNPEAIARPIFDGLPKPTTGRRNKAALD